MSVSADQGGNVLNVMMNEENNLFLSWMMLIRCQHHPGLYADYEEYTLTMSYSVSSITKLRTFPPERLIEAIRETVKFIYLGLKWSLLEQTKRGSKSRENIPLTLTS